MLNAALSGKLYAGNPHVRFDEKGVALEKPRHGSLLSADRIASKCLWVLGVIVGVVFGTQAARLTYVGTDGGNWTASNVWKTETGEACSWTDGNTAVISNVSVKLPSNVTVEGLEWSTKAKKTLTGNGKLTIGAGGIINGGSSEVNLNPAGGIHLSASQTWKTSGTSKRMLCLDGGRSVTAASGITITVSGGLEVRWAANGSLTSSETMYFTGSSYFSPAASRGLGSPTLIFDGYRNGANWISSYGESTDSRNWEKMASKLVLRNGACIKLHRASKFNIPEIVVDGTGDKTSTIKPATSGTPLSMLAAETHFDVAENCSLSFDVPFAESGVSAKIVKDGLGSLTVTTSNSYSGGLEVLKGKMTLSSSGAEGTGPVSVASGATLRLAQGITVRQAAIPAGTIELNGGNVVMTEDAEITQEDAAAHFSGAGQVKAGNGVTLEIGSWTFPADFVVDGEAGGRVEIGTASGSGWTKSGPGTVAVAEFANYEGGVTVSGGVLELASQAVFQGTVTTSSSGTLCLLSGVGLDLSKVAGTKRVSVGGTIDADPLTVSSGVFTVLSGASIQATTVKVTGGTLSVVDGAPYAEVEKLTLSGGTISFKETTTLPCPIDLTGSATVTAASPSADAEPVVGTLSGAVSAANATNKAKLSVTGSNGGIVQMAGGASFPKSNTELFVSSSGILEIVSNVVSFASYAGLEGEGKKILVKDGGTLRQTSGYLFIGSSSSTTSVVEVAAGGLLANASGGGVYLGVNGAFGRLVVSGGEVSLSGAGTFQCGYTTVPSGTPGKGEIVLSGGVLKAGRSLGIYSSSALAFDGGTLEFSGTYTSWFYGNFTMAVSVGANGGLLKTDGHDVGFRPCTIAGSGRLTVSGGGTVTFAGESPDWTGGILADGANLKAVNGLSFGTGSIGLASGASVDLGGNTVTAAGLFGAGTVKNGTLIASGPLTMTVGDMIVFNAATLDVTDSSLVATNPEDFGNRRWFAVRTSNGGAVTGATSLSHNLPQKNARVDVTAAGIVADPCLGLLLLVR